MNIEEHLASADFYFLKFVAICITVCELSLTVCALDYAVPGIDPRLNSMESIDPALWCYLLRWVWPT